jgi:hypothetical protein
MKAHPIFLILPHPSLSFFLLFLAFFKSKHPSGTMPVLPFAFLVVSFFTFPLGHLLSLSHVSSFFSCPVLLLPSSSHVFLSALPFSLTCFLRSFYTFQFRFLYASLRPSSCYLGSFAALAGGCFPFPSLLIFSRRSLFDRWHVTRPPPIPALVHFQCPPSLEWRARDLGHFQHARERNNKRREIQKIGPDILVCSFIAKTKERQGSTRRGGCAARCFHSPLFSIS